MTTIANVKNTNEQSFIEKESLIHPSSDSIEKEDSKHKIDLKLSDSNTSPSSITSSTEDEESLSYFERTLRKMSQDTDYTIKLEDEPDMTGRKNSLEKLSEEEEDDDESDTNQERRLSYRLSISSEDLNDISLTEERILPHRIVTDPEPIESPISSPTRSIFSLWSSFRSNQTSPASSRRPSKQAVRPSSGVASRQQSSPRPTSIISPLPGFQEALLAQMEQLNAANGNDPKASLIKKRQSIRQSLVVQNKGDDQDWDFWAGIMCDYESIKINKDLIKHVRLGIPPSIRGMVWQILAKSKDEELVTRYMDLLRLPSPFEKMIQRDLTRTFPGHQYFKKIDGQGQEGLFNVVKAYSIYDEQVGYCQGLGFIVGPILLNMPDEDSFCLLVQLMKQYGLRGHFTPDMDGLQLRLYQFDALLQEYLPHIARHLKQQGISSTMYASQWFMTLFAYKFPLNLVYRIYDVIFAEGLDSIFKFALVLLKKNQSTIIGLDFDQLLDFLKNGLFEDYKNNDGRFVQDACELEISSRRLNQLDKEYRVQKQKELADASLIQELQKANAELANHIKSIENKSILLKYEQKDMNTQLRKTTLRLNSLKEEGASLRTVVSTLISTINDVPAKIQSCSQERFDELCHESAELTEKNAALEERLQKAEATLIDFKIRYAQSENEKEELHKKLHELKKLMSF